ncbi:hypothetical protein GW17_00055633 [Ensete ventricosum]|nr:hypothetical protein GW17_00055633 [Ensete ventricosum]RZS01538.1 hypothetical protein BHM03_00031428 [Ensete ventricosum]
MGKKKVDINIVVIGHVDSGNLRQLDISYTNLVRVASPLILLCGNLRPQSTIAQSLMLLAIVISSRT